MRENVIVTSPEEKTLRNELAVRNDAEARRMEGLFVMPDLSRTEGSPIKNIIEQIAAIEDFTDFDIISVPEITPVPIAFDFFDFALDHPARSVSDTYYINPGHILRTQTTVAWYYYLTSERAKEKMKNKEPIGVFCYGKVYRKDEIDRKHMNVFHQLDGFYLVPKDQKEITLKVLQDVEANIAKQIFGEQIEFRFLTDTFPYTDPSTQIEVKFGDEWLEILGSGVIKPSVLEKLGVDSSIYNGWAFGFGVERWAMISMELPDIRLLWSDDERVKKQLVLGQKYKEVSKFPPAIRDISFIVSNNFVLNDYFDAIRDIGGDSMEEVALLDKYENATKFGEGKMSYTFRITYRDLGKTLTSEEANSLHKKIEEMTVKDFGGVIRES